MYRRRRPARHPTSQPAPKGSAPNARCADHPAGVSHGQCACRQVRRGPGRRPPKQAAAAAGPLPAAGRCAMPLKVPGLAIAYSGCQSPCYPRHGTQGQPPCAPTTYDIPWLVFLPRRKTAAPSFCAQEPLARSLSHGDVRQGVGVSKKIQHAHSPAPGGPAPPYLLGYPRSCWNETSQSRS